ncbi:MAG: dTMP kinase [Armatimonadota bacterium]
MQPEFYSIPVPKIEIPDELPGKLIVLEGTDGVGRSIQTQLLRNWLESSGLAVYDTGLRRSRLAGTHIQEAKEGHTMSHRTQSLYYATDFADRLENEIIPALRAGFVVLTDRYIYSLMARAAVRGMEHDWLRKLYGFALKPHLILYLEVSIANLIPRVLNSGGFDYWESGLDYLRKPTRYEAFVAHQTALLEEFGKMIEEFDFYVVDADMSIQEVFEALQEPVKETVRDIVPGAVRFTDMVVPMLPQKIVEAQQQDSGDSDKSVRDFLTDILDEE